MPQELRFGFQANYQALVFRFRNEFWSAELIGENSFITIISITYE